MRTINILGRKMPILAILMGLLVIGTASAAITYFAFSGTIEVTSPFGENQYDAFNIELIAGDSEYTYDYITVENGADTPILVELNTIVTDSSNQVITSGYSVLYTDNDGIVLPDVDNDGDQELVIPSYEAYIHASITTDADLPADIYTVNVSANSPENVDFVELTYKDSEWNPTDEMDGYVIYATSSDDFEFCVKATGLDDAEDYYLMYYADDADRFDNPNSVETTIIATIGLGDYYPHNTNELFLIDSVSLGHSLPHPDDANADSSNHDYRGAPDFYKDSTGARLWLVPSDKYDGTSFDRKAQDEYLFDNGLINYECTS